ncbi:MAG: hypothetical protein Q8K35_02030 [Thiobacillus sp.]|nr:hypothetical protein [Thiobacillus sp.]
MSSKNPIGYRLNGRSVFIQEFLKHPLQIGAIIPISHFLERRIVAVARVASANVVVELAPEQAAPHGPSCARCRSTPGF